MAMEVKILGKTYSVRSEFDPSFTTQTAHLVDQRIRELARKTGSLSTEKVAILAAMNFAGELLRLQKEDQNRRKALLEKTNNLLKIVDSQL